MVRIYCFMGNRLILPCKIIFLVLFLFLQSQVLLPGAQAKESPLSVEERNQRAMQEMTQTMQGFKQVQQGTFELPPPVDYSQYLYLYDFKNKFANWPRDGNGAAYKDGGSIWQKNEQKRYRAYLAGKKIKYLVLPIEDFAKNNDAISKLLSARYIARLLAQQKVGNVLDPEVFLKAYGERQAFFDDKQFSEFFPDQNYWVVHLFLNLKNRGMVLNKQTGKYGHGERIDQQYELAVVVSDKKGKIETFKILTLSREADLAPLEVKIAQIAPEIVSVITGKKVGETDTAHSALSPAAKWELKGDFPSLLKQHAAPLDQAAYLELLGMLTPKEFLQERAHLFERALCLLDRTANSERSVLLRARALYYLHRRPLAMQLLQGRNSAELFALRAYLNGNYHTLRDSLASISDPLLYTMTYIELHGLARAYEKDLPVYEVTKANAAWQELIDRRVREDDPWYLESDEPMMDSMVSILPLSKQIIQDVSTSLSLNKDHSDGLLDMEIQLASALAENILVQPDAALDKNIGQGDMIELYRNIVCSNLVRKLNHTVYLQGSYKRGVNIAEKSAALLQGLPDFSYLYGLALYRQAQQKQASLRGYDLEQARENSCLAELNSYPFEEVSNEADSLLFSIRNAYREKWSSCSSPSAGHYFPSDQKGLRYTVLSYRYLGGLNGHAGMSDAEYREILNERFDGDPQKVLDQARGVRIQSGRKEAIALLQKAIQTERQGKKTYIQLGDYYLEEGRFADASKAYFSYPPFLKVPDEDRVSMANLGYDLGERFFSLGHFEEAVPFFDFSLSFHTGSGREMTAAYQRALVKGNYDEARQIAYRLWDRYHNGSALGRYCLLSDLVGTDTDLSQQVVTQLTNCSDSEGEYATPLWNALALYDRMQGRDLQKTVQTVAEIKKAHKRGMFTVLVDQKAMDMVTIDKQMTETVHDQIAHVTALSYQRSVSTALQTFFQKHCPGVIGVSQMDIPRGKAHRKWNKDADLYLAFQRMQEKRYDDALQLFLLYDRNGGDLLQNNLQARYLFPYFLLTFFQSGSYTPERFQQLVDLRASTRKVKDDSVDDYLVEAMCSLSQFQLDQAVASFQKSYRMLYDVSEVYWERDWYQLFQVAEMLYGSTMDNRFLSTTLEWARRLQVVAPSLAWPHAFAALYGQDEEKRQEDAAIAMHLDPSSWWLRQVPEKIKNGGQIRWQKIQKNFNQQTAPAVSDEDVKAGKRI